MENRNHFYRLFWGNKSCYNLFLLSKGELLDTRSFPMIDGTIDLSFPRIIVSNYQEKEVDNYQIAIRNDKQTLKSENILQSHIQTYTPLITQFLEENFGKMFEKVIEDLKEPSIIIGNIFSSLVEKKWNFEAVIIKLLQQYGFAGQHINSFDDLEKFYKTEFLQKRIEKAISSETFFNILEFLRNLKDIYLNEIYRGHYSSNQVLINTLNSEDGFESRIKLFDIMFDTELIKYSNEEVFVECHNCDPGIYKGTLHLKLRPKKLNQMKCPVCQSEVTYFTPYNLDQWLFDVIKSQDGLILDALEYLLDNSKLKRKSNTIFNDLKGLEIDCIFEKDSMLFIVETKMFKLNTEHRKLEAKIKSSSYKLSDDTKLLSAKFPNMSVYPILLVNITDEDKLIELSVGSSEDVKVMSLASIKNLIQSK